MKKLLIANRGEIAVRIARTAAAEGLATVAVAPADDPSPHAAHADERRVLPGTGAAAYLDAAALVRLALDAGCDAVHPGYGFLSEQPAFAQACEAAGLVFVGPSPETLATLGDKQRARSIAEAQSVPVLPASGTLTGAKDLTGFQAALGYPVIVKAVAGGGGRGLRRMERPADAEAILKQCRAEAENAFGDDRLYAELYLSDARHVEVQLAGDAESVSHLWDRDCTLQRRHQKVVELAPAPELSAPLRKAILEAARQIGEATALRGLATVEFLVGPDATAADGWAFLEVNPRLQVEHTVTEAWLGLDLVSLQLRLARGDRLRDLDLPAQPPRGFALQARVNAETVTPDGIVPSGGTIGRFLPPGGPGVRVDTHAAPGLPLHPGFDSLLAKVIVHEPADNPGRLLARARNALAEFDLDGIRTNLDYLQTLLGLPVLTPWRPTTETASGIFSRDLGGPGGRDDAQHGIRAPLPGAVASVEVAAGDVYAEGDLLILLEAMKMQHEVRATGAGRVTALHAAAGEVVAEGQLLLEFAPLDGAAAGKVDAAAPDPDHVRADLQALRDRAALTLDENRPEAVKRRRSRGQRTARENLSALTAGAPFLEYGALVHAAQRRRRSVQDLRVASPADGIITGVGHVNADLFGPEESRVALLLYDGSVMAGTQGFLGHKKTDRLLEIAREQNLPVIFYTEGGGGRPGDEDFADVSVSGLDVKTFNLMTRLTADKPSIGVNSGYCFAGNAAVFGACDIKIATRESWIGLGGPAMVEAGGLGTHSPRALGPAPMQAEIGLVDVLARDEEEATVMARRIFGYFQGPLQDWRAPDERRLRHVVPENRKRVYDMANVIDGLADIDSWLELRPDHGRGLKTGFCRIEGEAYGVIANNPGHLGGALDATACNKGAGFLHLCHRFELPVISLCDTPGFMVGPHAEEQGGVAAACALIGAGAALADRLFTVVTRKGYGIGAQAMAGGSFAAPVFVISWPTGEFGAMGLEGAVELGYRKELEAAPDPEAKRLLFEDLVASSYARGQALNVASLQEIDAVIDPAETRRWIAESRRTLRALD